MAIPKPVHPIRRVRQALKATPEEMGLRQYATSAGFAKFLGRSSSMIRNVECGITTTWGNLATTIQRKTSVSSVWLLSDPGPDEPILDVRGKLWSPSRALDPLRPRKGMPDWRMLLGNCPGTLPRYMAQLVEAQMVLELSLGQHKLLEHLVSVLHRSGTFANPALAETRLKTSSLIREGMDREVWRTDHTDVNVVMMLTQLRNRDVSLTIEHMQDLLNAGGCGWAAKVTNASGEGIIGEARRFYDELYPSMREPVEGTDAELD